MNDIVFYQNNIFKKDTTFVLVFNVNIFVQRTNI